MIVMWGQMPGSALDLSVDMQSGSSCMLGGELADHVGGLLGNGDLGWSVAEATGGLRRAPTRRRVEIVLLQ